MTGARMLAGVCFVAGLVLAAGCSGSSGGASAEESTLEACQDKEDNDGDGDIDCADSQCQVFVACLGFLDTAGETRASEVVSDAALDTAEVVPDLAPEAVAEVVPDVPPEVEEPWCDPCGYGSLKGRVCAPSQQVFVAGATVTINTVDCDGKSMTLKTTTNSEGIYYFDSVPCGYQTIQIYKGSFTHEFEVPIKVGKLMDVSGADMKMCFAASATSIAVLWGQWDEMNDIVERLGFAYDWYYYEEELFAEDTDWETTEVVQFLRDPALLGKYNIIVLNCGSAFQKWAEMFPDIAENLGSWVLNGGSLYASDLAWIMIEEAFPGAIDFYGTDDKGYMASDGPQIIDGNQDFKAYIVDAQMAGYVGEQEMQVHYGPGPLISVAKAGPGTMVHAKAQIVQCQGLLDSCTSGVKLNEFQPTIVSFSPDPMAGRVVYSCFHVDEQADQDKYDKILYYMMFML
jgi:hypothetical protein